MSTRSTLDETTRTVAHDEPAASASGGDGSGTALPVAAHDAPAARVAAFVDGELQHVIAAVSLWCGSVDDAEQAVADATGRAWERLDRGRRIDNLAAWITTVAMNDVRARHRRRDRFHRKGHLVVVDGTAPGADDHAADRLDLGRALGRLGERQRQVVALFYGLDLPIADVATQLGIAEGTVKATLHRARQLLADELHTPADEGSAP